MTRRWGNRRCVQTGLWLALGGAVAFAGASSIAASLAALGVMGLGFAPIYPCLMHEVPARFVPEAVQTIIGRQSGGAYVGAALVPAVAGMLASRSLDSISWLVVGLIVMMIVGIRQLDRQS